MIALDTNVLVRILVEDDAEQTARARALVEDLDRSGQRAHVADIVLAEVAWVLRTCYDFGRKDIARALGALLAARQLAFENAHRAHRALASYEGGKGDFADYGIRESARAADCTTIKTFDKALLREDLFSPP